MMSDAGLSAFQDNIQEIHCSIRKLEEYAERLPHCTYKLRELLNLIDSQLRCFWQNFDLVYSNYYALAEADREWLERYSPRWWPKLSNAISRIKDRYDYTRRRKPNGEYEFDWRLLRSFGVWAEHNRVHETFYKALRDIEALWRDYSGRQAGVTSQASTIAVADTARERRRSGRKKADYGTIQKEAELAADWERARDAGTYKADFARGKSLTVRKLNVLLNRVSKRKSRADK